MQAGPPDREAGTRKNLPQLGSGRSARYSGSEQNETDRASRKEVIRQTT